MPLAVVGFGLAFRPTVCNICRTGLLRDTMGRAIRLLPMGTWKPSGLNSDSCPSIATLDNELIALSSPSGVRSVVDGNAAFPLNLYRHDLQYSGLMVLPEWSSGLVKPPSGLELG